MPVNPPVSAPVPVEDRTFLAHDKTGGSGRMWSPSGERRFRPWLGAACLSGGVALVLSGSPPYERTGTVDLYLSTVAAEGIVCPNVAEKLPDVPAAAKAEVDRNL